MASFSTSSSCCLISVLLISSLLVGLGSYSHEKTTSPPLSKGLSWSFYESSCPRLETIVRKELKKIFKKDIGQAAGLLRVHFHDCFVQGCDASVLLDGSASGPSEQDQPPNLTLRSTAFDIINELRERVHEECGQVVSCADITALAARDSVFLSGGPDYYVPLGRRDGLNFATRDETLTNLPPPTSNASALLTFLATKNLDATDLVALSGGHTIGIGHCTSFENRLYPTQDPTLEEKFADSLKETCPEVNWTSTTVLDIRTPNSFDNKYYVDLVNRQGLFTSDQDLYTDTTTRPIVKSFAKDEELFFEKFVFAMLKMGKKGEIRANCSALNSPSTTPITCPECDSTGEYLSSVTDSEYGKKTEL